MLIFNPFDHVNRVDIIKRVAKLRRKKSKLSNEEIAGKRHKLQEQMQKIVS